MTTIDKMRMLEPEFCKMPGQALCCSLYNYDEVLTKEEMTDFSTAYLFADITGMILLSEYWEAMRHWHTYFSLANNIMSMLLFEIRF